MGFSAVGSLREEVRPRDFLVVGGVVDWTRGVSWGGFLWGEGRTVLMVVGGDRFARGRSSKTGLWGM